LGQRGRVLLIREPVIALADICQFANVLFSQLVIEDETPKSVALPRWATLRPREEFLKDIHVRRHRLATRRQGLLCRRLKQIAIARIKPLGDMHANSRPRSPSIEEVKGYPKNTADNGAERNRANVITPLD
jgi:hypothetical protein